MKKVMRVMRTVDTNGVLQPSRGDTSVAFDDTVDDAQLSEARRLFDAVVAKGQAVFAVNRADGQPDKRVTDFSELEAENVVIPRLAGG